jgi:hypothetical protein
MKTQLLPRLSLVLSIAALLAGCVDQPNPAEPSAALANSDSDTSMLMQPVSDSLVSDTGSSDEGDISDAPVKPAELPNSVTAPIQLTGALGEMVHLAESGVDENVLMAYVTNCTRTFNAGPEEIIYLNDIGITPQVVTAMIVHDREIRDAVPAPSLIPAGTVSATLSTASYTAPMPTAGDPTFSRDDLGTETYAAPAQPSDVAADDFYGSLAPYGNWVDVAGYGRCWQPTVVSLNADWRPYCDGGRWVYSDCGWYWLSDYSWGWAPFHYGRWFRHTQLGWCWVPDTVWGPSWVSWRYSDDYCGWAPLPPLACFRSGYGFTYAGHLVAATFDFGLTPSCFTFVPFRNFCDHRLTHHIVARNQVDTIFHRTIVSTRVQVHNHIVINNGLPADRVTAATHTDLHPVAVRQFRGTAARGLHLEHLEAGGSVLTVGRPSRSTPTRTTYQPVDRQAAAGSGNSQLLANAPGGVPTSPPRQVISRPQRFPSMADSRTGNADISAPSPQPGAPLVHSQSQTTAGQRTAGAANSKHEIVIRSYPDPAIQAPSRTYTEAAVETPPQNPSWLRSGDRLDARRQQQNTQRAPRQDAQVLPVWNGNTESEPQALVQRRSGPREMPQRADFGNSFTAPQFNGAPAFNAAEANPRVNPQPSQYQYQPPQTISQPEPRSNFRSQPAESRAPAMESRSSYAAPVHSAPTPAPAPAVHERSSSNDRSSDRQDRQSSGRSR